MKDVVKRSKRSKKYRDQKKAQGLCFRCGKFKVEAPHAICETCRESVKAASQARRRKDKVDVFNHYGQVCTCCKQEFDEAFLTLNHVNNDGAQHKKTLGPDTL